MAANAGIAKWQTAILWVAFSLYALSRVFQLYPDKFPILLIVGLQVVPRVTDASGRQWFTMDILIACALISVLAMLPMTLLSWHRLKIDEARG
jgi:hypothetical protein